MSIDTNKPTGNKTQGESPHRGRGGGGEQAEGSTSITADSQKEVSLNFAQTLPKRV